jgi:hypothetical protein
MHRSSTRRDQSGYGFALAGVVVGIATLLLGGFFTAFASSASRKAPNRVSPAGFNWAV